MDTDVSGKTSHPGIVHGTSVVALAILGGLISFWYGRLGYMPLDQSVVFDGAWRILDGQVPFRDFTTPSGVVPMYMQALFFWALGVNWTAYLLHAAIANGVFAVLTFLLLRSVRTPLWVALHFSVLAAVFYYAPIGVPYPEQHSFLFGLLALVLSMSGRNATGRRARTCAAFVGIALVLSILSKQIPGVLFVPLILMLTFDQHRDWIRSVLWIGLGAGSFLFGLIAAAAAIDLPLATVWRDLYTMPSQVGAVRSEALWDLSSYMHDFGTWSAPLVLAAGALLFLGSFSTSDDDHGGRLSPLVLRIVLSVTALLIILGGSEPALDPSRVTPFLVCLFVIYASGVIASRYVGSRVPVGTTEPPLGRLVVMGTSLVVLSSLFASLTNNQPENSVALIPIALGTIAAATWHGVRDRSLVRARRLAIAVTVVLVVIGAIDAVAFHRSVNTTRVVNDMRFQHPTPPPNLPDGLTALVWDVPESYSFTAEDLTQTTAFLTQAEGNFLLIGDATIMYGLAEKSSVAPVLFWHPGLTYPSPDDPEFAGFQRLMIDRITSEDVRWIVEEGSHTWMGTRLSDFPQVEALVERYRCDERRFGAYRLTRISFDGCAEG